MKVNQVTIKAYNTTTDNLVHTYWQESTYKVPKGFKFTGKTSMKVSFQISILLRKVDSVLMIVDGGLRLCQIFSNGHLTMHKSLKIRVKETLDSLLKIHFE